MRQAVEQFFQQYATAYSNFDVKQVSALFSLPCLFLTDDSKVLMAEITALEKTIQHQFDLYRGLGVAQVRNRVQHLVRLSDSMVFASLYWYFCDAEGKVLQNCHTSYTLQRHDEQWLLVSVMIDDERFALKSMR
ncbi:nuclear transport factor 2 family protein [Alkalimonas collagenimarina]|uniref:Nuclear transport factor 2 family protein n=1 Tax=Alkalimonas collagenimarina TaxID=400390 RepID=A0ABT9GXX0_9GAMM|nr:nuclear transport factor 2 family protein [Alkalimonas collagenimarina]MDP4535911.1 nuclear transport factor 2 family protein [Alkalimonas collagenimarina]